MFKAHHVGVILQSLFMIPVAVALHALARQQFPSVNRATLALGVVSLSLMVLCALLFIVNVVADDLYTVPQGVLGVWLMIVNRRLSSVLSRGITWFGTVVGFGLLLVGTFPLAYGIFVDPIGLHGPVPPDYPDPPFTTANTIIHNVFLVGSLLGVNTYPIWTMMIGRRLLRSRLMTLRLHPVPPNQPVERTATRCAFTPFMTKTSSLRASSCSVAVAHSLSR